LAATVAQGTTAQKELYKALSASRINRKSFPCDDTGCAKDLRLTEHMGAGGINANGKMKDTEGARDMVWSIKTTTRAVATIHRNQF